MYRPARKLVRTTFGALVAGSLGFGVSQALAAPSLPARAPLCMVQQCTLSCLQRGYAGGICNPDAICVCLVA